MITQDILFFERDQLLEFYRPKFQKREHMFTFIKYKF